MADLVEFFSSLKPNYVTTVHHDVYPAIDVKKDLKGALSTKSVLVTGASRGIGRQTALVFAEAQPAKLALIAQKATNLDSVVAEVNKRFPSVQTFAYGVDVSSAKDVEQTYAQIASEVGTLDVILNNSGISGDYKTITESDPRDWLRVLQVNVFGAYLMSREFIKQAKTDGTATVINTSSIVTTVPIVPGQDAYIISKTAVNRVTESIATTYPHIRSYAFHPAATVTDMSTAMRGNALPEEVFDQLMNDTLDLAAGAALWLTTDDAKPAQGGYVSSNWDVTELKKAWENGAQPLKTVISFA